MNMTDVPQYIEFGTCLSEGRMNDALDCLDSCIEIVGNNKNARARLMQFKGNILWQVGKNEEAITSYDNSFKALPDSPLIMLGYARFLATLGLEDKTNFILARLDRHLNNNWQRQSANEHSSGSYYDRIEEIKNMLAGNNNKQTTIK